MPRLSAMILVILVIMLPLAGCHLVFPFGVQPPGQPQDGAARERLLDSAPDTGKVKHDGSQVKHDGSKKDAVTTCPKPRVLCGGTCVDTTTNPVHCGKCNNVCTSNPCKNAVCTSGTCSSNKPNGTTCPGGKCHGGSCCTGCINASGCQSGTSTAVCGTAGGPCQKCTAPGCKLPTCQGNGSCGTKNASDGTACPGGTCYNGGCCQVCWDGSKCVTVESNAACGTGGVVCVDCTANQCQTSTCNNYKCTAPSDVADGTKCFVGPTQGQCSSGACCTGCRKTGGSGSATCEAGIIDNACGTEGKDCIDCTTLPTMKKCIGGVCM